VREAGADFVVFGPVFPTQSKKEYGPSLGVGKLSEVAHELAPFPVLAMEESQTTMPVNVCELARAVSLRLLYSASQRR